MLKLVNHMVPSTIKEENPYVFHTSLRREIPILYPRWCNYRFNLPSRIFLTPTLSQKENTAWCSFVPYILSDMAFLVKTFVLRSTLRFVFLSPITYRRCGKDLKFMYFSSLSQLVCGLLGIRFFCNSFCSRFKFRQSYFQHYCRVLFFFPMLPEFVWLRWND